jgi:hypothetical protein
LRILHPQAGRDKIFLNCRKKRVITENAAMGRTFIPVISYLYGKSENKPSIGKMGMGCKGGERSE